MVIIHVSTWLLTACLSSSLLYALIKDKKDYKTYTPVHSMLINKHNAEIYLTMSYAPYIYMVTNLITYISNNKNEHHSYK